ncbi:MAG TPA: LPS assembly protein LptD [Phycisphaerae bacterium]
MARRLVFGAWLAATVAAAAQSPVPLGEHADEPALPTGISIQNIEMFGVLMNRWAEPDGTHVIYFVGDFELHMGLRRLKSREAVIWMTHRSFEGRAYVQYEIYLWRDARVTEPAGTVTSGPVLFVTLNSSGKMTAAADRSAGEPPAKSEVYAEALHLRDALRAQAGAPLQPQAPKPVEVVGPGAIPAQRETVRPPVGIRSPNRMIVAEVDGQEVLTATDVYVFRGTAGGEELLELRADAAVLFMKKREPRQPGAARAPPDETEKQPSTEPGELTLPLGGFGEPGPDEKSTGFLPGGAVEGVYLEGDVVLTRGERMVRADRLYYDMQNERALILDAVLRATIPEQNVPLYVRAAQIRQLSRDEYVAYKARVTTSEFFTPHYHIGAERVEVLDQTVRSESGGIAGLRAGTFAMTQTTFNIEDFPVLYWPYARGDFKEGESPLRSFRTGYSDHFGVEVETEWHLFNLLGLRTPLGFDAKLRLDYFSERGPAIGIDTNYQTENSFGLFRGYYIHDTGEDHLGRFRDNTPDTENRGRLTWRHRQYLPNDWQLTLEGSYISDRGFLEEYLRREEREGKDQETLIHLKKQENTWAFTALAQWRILDWYTQTERLPDFSFRVIAQPIADAVTWFSENRAGFVRYRPAERDLLEDIFLFGGREQASRTVARVDTRQELDRSFRLGDLTVVPFGSIRGSAWDDSPDAPEPFAPGGGGGVGRVLGTYGLRGSGYASRVFPEIESDLLDLHGIRHVIKPDFVAWLAHGNLDSRRVFPFDEAVEAVDDFDGVGFGLRQRWQTKRGGPSQQRIVDVFLLDLEAGFFGDVQPFQTTPSGHGLFERARRRRHFVQGAQADETTYGFTSFSRPESSIHRNYASAMAQWRISDTTVLIADSNFDLNDHTLGVFNLSYAVERTPRLSYVLGYRFINEINSNLIGGGLNYKISEKYTFGVREEFDLDRGRTGEFSVVIIRKLPRWYFALTFDLDNIENDIGVSVSAWPEGLPRATLGSRRFTGLSESTGIRPD